MNNLNNRFKYGTLMTGGICQCGGKLIYSSWQTKDTKKERLTCNACGRTNFAEELKQVKQLLL